MTTLRAPGGKTLALMLGLLAAGVVPLALLATEVSSWPAGALVGYTLSGLMGLSSLWALRRALRVAGQAAFMRGVFGAMGIRLGVAGLTAGLVIGFGWLSAGGFIGGLFGGLLVFQAVEIAGVLAAARRAQGRTEGEPHHAG